MAFARIAKLPKSAHLHTAIAAPSQAATATMLNVSIDTGLRAKRVLDKANSELIKAVERWQIAVSKAAELTKVAPEFQRAVVQ